MFIAKPGNEKLQDLPKWPAVPEASPQIDIIYSFIHKLTDR
jgi:hypothetical protein